jgi:hypothetical protein
MKSLAIRDYNLDYPLGTTETFAYQTFNASRADLRKCAWNFVFDVQTCRTA